MNNIYLLIIFLIIGLIALGIFLEAIKNDNYLKRSYTVSLFCIGFLQGFFIGWFVTSGGVFYLLWIKLLSSIFAGLAWSYQPKRWKRIQAQQRK